MKFIKNLKIVFYVFTNIKNVYLPRRVFEFRVFEFRVYETQCDCLVLVVIWVRTLAPTASWLCIETQEREKQHLDPQLIRPKTTPTTINRYIQRWQQSRHVYKQIQSKHQTIHGIAHASFEHSHANSIQRNLDLAKDTPHGRLLTKRKTQHAPCDLPATP